MGFAMAGKAGNNAVAASSEVKRRLLIWFMLDIRQRVMKIKTARAVGSLWLPRQRAADTQSMSSQ
jgi:hypothetical protein